MHIKLSNSKLQKSNGQYMFGHFSLPAIRTCPNADRCKIGCYATQGRYIFPSVRKSMQTNLLLTKNLAKFQDTIEGELKKLMAKASKADKDLAIRIHTSGDFYSKEYFNSWLAIVEKFPSVRFYAYTKMVWFVRVSDSLPSNITFIMSEGGKEDSLIQPDFRHARVFPSVKQLLDAGYDDASNDDAVAFLSESGKIGLVYHGAKSKEWTSNKQKESEAC